MKNTDVKPMVFDLTGVNDCWIVHPVIPTFIMQIDAHGKETGLRVRARELRDGGDKIQAYDFFTGRTKTIKKKRCGDPYLRVAKRIC